MSENLKENRKARNKRRKAMTKTQKRNILIICILLLVIGFAYGKKIVSLKIENAKLKKENTALIEERNKIKKKLKNVDNVAYIEEQARKQLQLMYPDEILFKFQEDTKEKKNGDK